MRLNECIVDMDKELKKAKKQREAQFQQQRLEEFEKAYLRDPQSATTQRLALRFAFGCTGAKKRKYNIIPTAVPLANEWTV